MSSSPPPETVPGSQDVAPPETQRADFTETQLPTATQAAVFNDVFGDDGGDSDNSDNEGPSRSKGGRAVDDDDEDEGAYVPATETSAARIPSFKKRRGSGAESGGDDDDEERQRKKKKKKDRRADAAADEEEEPVLDEATQRRHALEERIDNIGKKQRVVRRKKKNNEDGDIVDTYHDDVCIRLRERMMTAAAKDAAANQAKLPATNKLAMLDEVVSALQNTTLWSSIIDNDVLKAVKLWLDPLPDKSLPSPGIQRAIFEVLPKMDLDTTTIRESKLGPVVLFYTKTKRVTPAISRQADQLVEAWSRPIVKRSADFRSRFVATAEEVEREIQREREGGEGGEEEGGEGEGERRPRPKTKATAKPKRFDVRSALAENQTRKGARLPQVREVQYTIAPESRLTHHREDLQHVSRIQMDNKKFNRFARQLQARKK